jgi:hypothetical protein
MINPENHKNQRSIIRLDKDDKDYIVQECDATEAK